MEHEGVAQAFLEGQKLFSEELTPEQWEQLSKEGNFIKNS